MNANPKPTPDATATPVYPQTDPTPVSSWPAIERMPYVTPTKLMVICAEIDAHVHAARNRHPHLFARANAGVAVAPVNECNETGLRRW